MRFASSYRFHFTGHKEASQKKVWPVGLKNPCRLSIQRRFSKDGFKLCQFIEG
jgi:hypothetical protein